MANGQSREQDTPSKEARSMGVAGFLIGPAFLVLAALMLFVLTDSEIPTKAAPAVRSVSISNKPLRTPLGDPPITTVNGQQRSCNDCHDFIESRDRKQSDLQQHTEISLAHGLNNNCYNCHDREDREKLVLHDGSTIGYTHGENLCAQCHGRVYRDWTRGAHGKTIGSWDPQSESFERLTCAQCHDPHAPMFDQMEPLPGPNTLRMGKPDGDTHSGKTRRNPLLQWSEPGGDHDAHSDGAHDGGHD